MRIFRTVAFVFFISWFLSQCSAALAFQEMIVEPFLQQATSSSIWVVWETDEDSETRVEYGLTDALGSEQVGAAIPNVGSSIIHQAKLTDLLPETKYYYRVVTGAAVSGVFDFKTPAKSTSGYPLRFAAYSDAQIDGGNPNKHQEIVNDGIISYVAKQYGPDLCEELDFVMVPGDLVSTGGNHSHWLNHFFGQAKNLYRHVPLYPVPGNHENNSPLYFRYFNLPENGTAGFIEHWYFHDYGNVRIIGLDSNPGFRIQEQLDWLETVLADAGKNQVVDFVFAQLHHPHKSELWTPGELDYTGDVIQRLEQFTSSTGKPSVHFFGHTHGYSRGQSRDHNHLWVNVASGGGNLDYWGEFANFDYPEFQYTTPEYGFTIVEVEAGDDPRFVMKRLSRGNEVVAKDNELIDVVTIRRNNQPPAQPAGIGCAALGHNLSPDEVLLEATDFSDPDGGEHLESQFQLALGTSDFSQPVQDLWIRKENWYAPAGATGIADGYFSVNNVSNPEILSVATGPLESKTQYFWRVRYRDDSLTWSEWSEINSFTTSESSFGPNLLSNAGAEDGVVNWEIVDSPLESLIAGECGSGTNPVVGNRFFAIGGVCANEDGYGEALQSVDVSSQADLADAGDLSIKFGAQLKNYSGADRPEVWLVFKDANNGQLGATPRLQGATPAWVGKTNSVYVPALTRTIEYHMAGTRFAGTDNDSYLDELNLQVRKSDADEVVKGDVNLDGVVNLLDVNPFVESLQNGFFQPEADVDCNCEVNLLDVAPFVLLLNGG